MSDYQLTETQKNLLRHIRSGLESGEVESHEIAFVRGYDGIRLSNLSGNTYKFWIDHVKKSDLRDFDKNGFITLELNPRGFKGRFTISEQPIIDAVDSDFKRPDVTPSLIIEGDVHAAVANIGGEIGAAGNLIATLNQVDADEREKLKILFGDLQRDLESLADREPEIAQKVSHTIRNIAEILNS